MCDACRHRHAIPGGPCWTPNPDQSVSYMYAWCDCGT